MLPLHGLGHAADASARSRPRFPRRRTETFGHYGHARNQRRGFGVSVRVTVAAALGLGLVTDLPANAQFWGGWEIGGIRDDRSHSSARRNLLTCSAICSARRHLRSRGSGKRITPTLRARRRSPLRTR